MSLTDGDCRHYPPHARLMVPTRQCRVIYRGKAWDPSTPSVEVASPVSQEHAHKVAVEKRQEWQATGKIAEAMEVNPA
jgi:hypothetical protein